METCQYIRMAEGSYTEEDGGRVILRYFLTCRAGDAPGTSLYGICVRKFFPGAKSPAEEETSPPISGSRLFVCRLLLLLSRNTVTPMCLLETLDELLCAC